VTAVHEGGGSSEPDLRRQWLVDSRLAYARKWGGEWRLRAALGAASAVNFAVNGVREVLGRDVDALGTLRNEISLLRRRKR
jgi:N-acetylglucosaminyl-diphospho-decaprenol L-rhamnosyltransferase